MKALGMIETYSLIAAIEAADVMLKVADVSLMGSQKVRGGLVMVSVEGDVGAVKTAVEAGASAIRRLEEACFISSHVIPRPDDQLATIYQKANQSIAQPIDTKKEITIAQETEMIAKTDVSLSEEELSLMTAVSEMSIKEYRRTLEKMKVDALRRIVAVNERLLVASEKLEKMVRRDMIDMLVKDFKSQHMN
ncbi:BMC domain-containing protein [Streptococcus iniae]